MLKCMHPPIYSRGSFSLIFDIYFNTKNKDFYFDFVLVKKWYAKQSEAENSWILIKEKSEILK